MGEVSFLSPWYALDLEISAEQTQQQIDYFAQIPLLQPLIDAVPDIFMIVNAKGQIVFANYALQRWLGLEAGHAAFGQRPGQVLDCEQAFRTPSGCGTREVCQTCGAAQAIMSSLHGLSDVKECRITRRDGGALDLRVWTVSLTVEDQPFCVLTLQDISDEKRRRTLERVFFHDLLNITNSLALASQSLLIAPPDRLDRIKLMIQQISGRLVNTITAQRDLRRAESGELQPRYTTINTRQLLEIVQRFYEVNDQGVLVEIAPDVPDLTLTSDGDLLERVLGNLVKNALEASQTGERVTLSCGNSRAQIWFEVHNPAVIPREVQLQIFQRSFSTKGEGRGLGTYSVKLLTERYLGGQVNFHSAPDAGTVFRVSYPISRQA